MDDNTKLYRKLWNSYQSAYPSKKHGDIDKDVSRIWNALKIIESEFPANVLAEIVKFKQQAANRKGSLDNFWKKVQRPKTQDQINDVEVIEPTSSREATKTLTESSDIGADDRTQDVDSSTKRVYTSETECKLNKQIQSLHQDVNHLRDKRDTGLATTEHLQELKTKQAELKDKEKKLKYLLDCRERKRRQRDHEKQTLKENPELAKLLRKRFKTGRPPLEDDQPDLLKAIVDIVTFGASADERRRSESLRSYKTLTELRSELIDRGFQISQSAVYTRLLPKRSNSLEGKRHVTTVPVKLKRAQNDLHKMHSDAMFCRTTIRSLEEIASVLGPEQVLFVSQDDKARVPIGITAANKQAPMLMHLEYLVKLPDHDWVVAEKHKLIPSVYGIVEIKKNMMGDCRAVGYSGPTYITVRSGKHCSSTASSHGRDLDSLLRDEDMLNFTRTSNGEIKPTIMLVVDGGPDENPRYEKVINEAVCTFRKYNLDSLYIATNAPGRSAFNRVERRMAPLSRELCGVILEHDHFGSHLDDRGRTIDEDLELLNFQHAGETLAEIWSTVVIDNYPTKAYYINPQESMREEYNLASAEWKTNHVRESHYFLQIAKCDDLQCCSPKRGTMHNVFPRFVPAPLCFDQVTLTANQNSSPETLNEFPSLLLRLRIDDAQFRNEKSGEVPYDVSCPSVKELLLSRTCGRCGLYFASVKSVKAHKRVCSVGIALQNPDIFGAPMLAQRANGRPVRIAARRQQELMVLWASQLNDEHVDWLERDEVANVETVDLVRDNSHSHSQINVVDLKSHMNVPWEDDV